MTNRRVRVKICGITNLHDATAAIHAGADALGFVFAPSPRQVTPEHAASIIRELPPFVTTVGLVVNQPVRPILEVCPVDVIQFHGDETPEVVAGCPRRAIRAIRVADEADAAIVAQYPRATALLLDAAVPGVRGGSGVTFRWELVATARANTERPIIVAGGLTPTNVAECVAVTRPWGVDVSSGVEIAPGMKDPVLIEEFVAAVRSLDSWDSR